MPSLQTQPELHTCVQTVTVCESCSRYGARSLTAGASAAAVKEHEALLDDAVRLLVPVWHTRQFGLKSDPVVI